MPFQISELVIRVTADAPEGAMAAGDKSACINGPKTCIRATRLGMPSWCHDVCGRLGVPSRRDDVPGLVGVQARRDDLCRPPAQ